MTLYFFGKVKKDQWIYHVRSRVSLVRLNKDHEEGTCAMSITDMKLSKQITASLICLLVLIGSLFIANQSALAEFKRGTVQRSRFGSTVVLDRAFGKPGGYIRERALRNKTLINPKVNVYDGHGKKIGYAKKDSRTGGINTYDETGKKTGYYRKALGSPNY